MDFGEILKKWEQGKTKDANMQNVCGKSVMETWLKNNEVCDKDADIQKTQIPGEKRRRLLNARSDDIIDIHGLTSEKAWLALEQFFENAKDCSFKKLRIIHGKGNHSKGEAVLGRLVRKFIEQCTFAGESGNENSANGGSGATWVFLKD
jgi:DNA-nicking Smr family endonuclease